MAMSNGVRRLGATSAMLSVCGALAAATEEPPSLEGTSWQLVQIQSMDDRVFTPDERGRYTLTFERDGRVLVQADCNRGQGTWTHEGPNGLEFGPLAVTMAQCPPDSLHDRYLSDLSYVRSYVARDGNIFLATMADGAILEFEPFPAKAAPTFDCAMAHGSVEEMICKDADLAALDVKLSAVYERALQNFPADQLNNLKAFQRGWIKGRNDCWKADDARVCVQRAYQIRITELQIQSGAVMVPETVGYTCHGGESITAVFYDNTQLPAAVLTRIPDDQVIAFLSPAASGAKYEGRNVTFWDKAGQATVTWNGRDLRCKVGVRPR